MTSRQSIQLRVGERIVVLTSEGQVGGEVLDVGSRGVTVGRDDGQVETIAHADSQRLSFETAEQRKRWKQREDYAFERRVALAERV